ncbi:hypothetical protein JCM13304A_03000 [Desulfothermus okinawensis JCM 13304]
MSTIMPEEKKLRDAITWISENRGKKKDPDLVKEASFRFNLNPKEEEYLLRVFRGQDTEDK